MPVGSQRFALPDLVALQLIHGHLQQVRGARILRQFGPHEPRIRLHQVALYAFLVVIQFFLVLSNTHPRTPVTWYSGSALLVSGWGPTSTSFFFFFFLSLYISVDLSMCML